MATNNQKGAHVPSVLGGTMDPDGQIIALTIKDGICQDCTVLAGKANIVFENGTRAGVHGGVYMHHLFS